MSALEMVEPMALGDERPCYDVVQLSIAISLKRIADSLARYGQGEDLNGLHGTITNMAWEAGRSFAAGQRLG